MSPEPDDTPIRPDAIAQGSGLPDDDLVLGGPAAGEGDDPLDALLGADSGLDLSSLMEQATQMQSQLMAAQQEAMATTVEGVAGGGAVRITVTGGFDFQGVTIDPSAVDPADVDMLQDLVLAALRDAAERINQLQVGSVDLKGMGLGDLFGG
jgi:nucleoid-associated protein EbfC